MAIKVSDLALKPEFVGELFYVKLVGTVEVLDGQKVSCQRHEVMSKTHGLVHVITPSGVDNYTYNQKLKPINPKLLVDNGVNGRNVSANKNILAEGFVKL